jgi:hypothetical protein
MLSFVKTMDALISSWEETMQAREIIPKASHSMASTVSALSHSIGDYEAQELVLKHASEVGIEIVPFRMVVYESVTGKYVPEDELQEGMIPNNISGICLL